MGVDLMQRTRLILEPRLGKYRGDRCGLRAFNGSNSIKVDGCLESGRDMTLTWKE